MTLVDQVHHQLLAKRSPRFAELIERCDADARATLVLAARLARQRIALHERLAALAGELQHPPWAEPVVAWREPSRGVTSTDLLRAALARHADRIANAAFAADDVDASFAAAVEYCRAFVATAGEDTGGIELDPVWARRWATIAGPLDRDRLLGGLTEPSVRRLAAFAKTFVEGLVTEDEAFNRAADGLSVSRIATSIVPMAPAYWDRHDGLAELDRLLVRPPGAVIVGPAGSGRHALIEAWGRRLRTGGPGELRRFGFNIDNFHGGGALEWKGHLVYTWAAVWERCICVLSRFCEMLDDENDASRRFPAYCLDFASDPANQFRLVIVTTPEDLERGERKLPALRALPRVEVPPIADDHLLPVWACQLPCIDDKLGFEYPLPRLIDRLAWRSPDRRRDFATHSDFAGEPALTDCEPRLARFASRVPDRWSERDDARLARFVEATPSLAQLGLGAHRWLDLLALADALRGRSPAP